MQTDDGKECRDGGKLGAGFASKRRCLDTLAVCCGKLHHSRGETQVVER